MAVNQQPLTATGDLACADKAFASFTPAACNYTGTDYARVTVRCVYLMGAAIYIWHLNLAACHSRHGLCDIPCVGVR